MTMTSHSSAGRLPGSEPKRVFGRAKAATVVALIVSACLWPGGCLADPMVLVESYPVVNQIMDGSATSFALRFDGPVDHAGAGLTLVTPTGARTLHARLVASRTRSLSGSAGSRPGPIGSHGKSEGPTAASARGTSHSGSHRDSFSIVLGHIAALSAPAPSLRNGRRRNQAQAPLGDARPAAPRRPR
jgi:hypothetical protein